MDLTVKRLTPDLLDEHLAYFDNDAFCDNPDWSTCYCVHFFVTDEEKWIAVHGRDNRSAAKQMIQAGKLNGFLAYAEGKIVGWCNAGDFNHYDLLLADPLIANDDTAKKAAVVCFVVNHRNRGKGVATALLRAACEHFEAEGYDVVEAYPKVAAKTAAHEYHGPLALYEKCGFEIVEQNETIYTVRRFLRDERNAR